MYRVTRKQKIVKDGNVIEFEDSRVVAEFRSAQRLSDILLANEQEMGGEPWINNKVIFETPTFYRSVQVTIEEIS